MISAVTAARLISNGKLGNEKRDKWVKILKKLFASDEKGATALEYGVLGALIAAVIVFSVQGLGITVDSFFAGLGAGMDLAIGN